MSFFNTIFPNVYISPTQKSGSWVFRHKKFKVVRNGTVFYKSVLMTRVILYLSIFSIVYISEVIDLFILNIDTTSVNRGYTRFLVVCGVIAITCVPLYMQLNKNLSDVIPYVSFLAT